ncbi:MAG: DUF5655 domain-containing protein [Pseudomonadota bacterium]
MTDEEKVEAYLSKLEPNVHDIALGLRARLNALGPDLTVKPAWGFPCWFGNERVASVIGHSDRCNLQLWSDNRLADKFPARIEGTGKALRHVKIRSTSDIDEEVDEIIKAAIALDASAPERVR